MSLFVCSLSSGSNGNCYYVGTITDAILVDAGISCRETEKRMKRLGLNVRHVKAIFISHEHGDHVCGLEVLSRKYQVPVFVTPATLTGGNLKVQPGLVRPFSAYRPVSVADFDVTAFPKFHDARDPHSFVISRGGVRVGVFTDIGQTCAHVTKNFSDCHAVFLESNYDERMLENGRYPYHLKARIRGGHGHLSNTQAAGLFVHHRPPFMTHLFLSHLSAENNRPAIVRDLFAGISSGTEIIIAPRDRETRLYHIRDTGRMPAQARTTLAPPGPYAQLALFQ